MNYIIELTDDDGNSGRIKVSLPLFKNYADTGNSTWKVLDEGFFKYRSGGCRIKSSTGRTESGVTGDLYLFVNPKAGWGVKLDDFIDEFSLLNSSGGGRVQQPWVVNFKPGSIGWTAA